MACARRGRGAALMSKPSPCASQSDLCLKNKTRFNRIEASVLSVVSTQMKSIQQALASHVTHFLLESNEIRLIRTMGIFVTMNPGYAGRTELPESVKTLFRPVVVV